MQLCAGRDGFGQFELPGIDAFQRGVVVRPRGGAAWASAPASAVLEKPGRRESGRARTSAKTSTPAPFKAPITASSVACS
jgi:hypothetical protein